MTRLRSLGRHKNRPVSGKQMKSRQVTLTTDSYALSEDQKWFNDAPAHFRQDVAALAQKVVFAHNQKRPGLPQFVRVLALRYPGTDTVARGYVAIPVPGQNCKAVISGEELYTLGLALVSR